MKRVPIQSDRPVAAARDAHGVPYIRGATFLDALYGLGYVHALDRGTQMLFGRSVASGRAAEQIANDAELLETDRFFRRFGLHLGLQEEVRLLSGTTGERLRSYADGVNAGLNAMGRSWPMWATGYQSQPWDEESVILIGRLLSFGGLATSQLQSERLLMELIHSGVDDDMLRELFAPRLDHVDLPMLRQVRMPNQLSNEALDLLQDLPRLAGSNAWAVSPRRSQSGGALLAADPHLEINRLPAIWYEAALIWRAEEQERYVMGATLPGCPLFAVARSSEVAWGVTYMKGDTIDYFVEDCRRMNDQWEYRRGERWLPFEVRQEHLVRKNDVAETMPVYHNPQGVMETDPHDLGEGLQLSLAWTGGGDGSGRAMEAWLDMLDAHTTRDAMQVARRCLMPTLCFVIADVEGHIGLQGCGRFPRRAPGCTGLTPIPAWDESQHWQGWLPERMLPSAYDPPSGFLATANEEWPVQEDVRLVTQFAGDYRQRRITELLELLPQATVEDMQRLQYDVYSMQARDLLQLFLPHLPAGELRDALRGWDCRFTPESREASLFMRLYWHVILELLGGKQAIGWRRLVYLCSRSGYSLMVLTAADRLLLNEGTTWWQRHDKGQLVAPAAADVEAAQPAWSQVNNFHFADRFFGNHQVGRLLGFQSRRHAMPGCHATPFQGHVLQTAKREQTFAPSYHFVADLGSQQAWTNLPGGPSENRFSRWYKSDVQRWLTGKYKPLCADQFPSLPE